MLIVVFGSIALLCHQMDTFAALLAICAGNSPVPSEFPARAVMHVGIAN